MNFIYDPYTMKKYDILSVEAKQILKKLIQNSKNSENFKNIQNVTHESVPQNGGGKQETNDTTNKSNEIIDFVKTQADKNREQIIDFPISNNVNNILNDYINNPTQYYKNMHVLSENNYNKETIEKIQNDSNKFQTIKGPSIENELKRCNQFEIKLTSLDIDRKQLIHNFMKETNYNVVIEDQKTFVELDLFKKTDNHFYNDSYERIKSFVQKSTDRRIVNYILDKINNFDVKKERYLFDFIFKRVRFNMIENILVFYNNVRDKINQVIKQIKIKYQQNPNKYNTALQNLRFILTGNNNKFNNLFNVSYYEDISEPTQEEYKQIQQYIMEKDNTYVLVFDELKDLVIPIQGNELRFITNDGYIVHNFNKLNTQEMSVYFVIPTSIVKETNEPVFIEDSKNDYDLTIELAINLVNKK